MSVIIRRKLFFLTVLMLLLFKSGECRVRSKKFYPDAFFSYYRCQGKFDYNKIQMLAFQCLRCYDGDWGGYRFRHYCSRDCFQSFTYENCLRKLKFSKPNLELIQKDFEFITNNKNFLKKLVNQGVFVNETSHKTESIDTLRVSPTIHRQIVDPGQNGKLSKSLTPTSSKSHQESKQNRKKISSHSVSLLGSG